MEQIVVTSTSTEKFLSEAPASISVITQNDLNRRVVMDLSDALRGQTGINLSAVGFGRKGIEIRGMDSDQTLVLIDGQRVGGSSDLIAHSNFELSSIPVNDIERIEVVRGPISALYGSDALGGVINVITKKVSKDWRSSLAVTGGQQLSDEDAQSYSMSASTSGSVTDDLSIRVSAVREYQQDVANRVDPNRSDIEGQKTDNLRLRMTWAATDNQTIDAMVAVVDDYRWHDTALRANYYTFKDDISRLQLSLQHQGYWSWGDSTIRMYRTEVDRENTRTNNISVTSPSEITEDITDFKLGTSLGGHQLHFGGQWLRQNLKDSVVNDSGERLSIQKSAFFQDDWALSDDLSLLLGGRFDQHDMYGWETSPRVYMVWSKGDWVFKGGYGEGFKAPSLKQLSAEYETSAAGGLFYIVGNPELQPETNKSYELSARYGKESWNITTTLFTTKAEDLIETFCISGCDGRGALRNYRNIESATLSGLEVSAFWRIFDDLSAATNFNYLDARNDSEDKALRNKPRTSGYAELVWKLSENIDTQLRLEHVGEQYLDDAKLPGYQLLHLSSNYRLNSQWSIRASINNLTDVYLLDESEQFEFVEQGRTLFLSAQMSF
ncbi:TonB-dependent receptor domain-containing protein [Pseudoalteromonas nigrifaciens]|uniref:TonB-dependent receptor domain-containing protein n=2 Tax=Pseudomonadota TaxID=1224 RepID=UPI001CE42F47|nr:TonB-dependent receptor [Pseudoalteromonas nigrifaciens]